MVGDVTLECFPMGNMLGIQTAVAFLTMMVWKPEDDDWRKIRQVIQYLHGTIYIPLILRYYSINMINWWVYALYAVHVDMRAPTGTTVSLDCGLVISMPKKQKINA